MNDLVDFLTSQEIIIVYIIAALACLVCFIVYLIEKNNEKLRRKHNTKELNKLVEEIKATLPEEEEQEIYDVPILETVMDVPETSINDVLQNEPVMVETNFDVQENVEVVEPEPVVEEVEEEEETPEVQYVTVEPNEELQYTSIEPDQETAKSELRKLEEELEKEDLEDQQNIELTSFEQEQERTAIISMEELMEKSKELYSANTITQYLEEGNEPISIQDLEKQADKQAVSYDTDPFVISQVVPQAEIEAEMVELKKEELHMDDFNTISEETVQPVVEVTVMEKKEPEVRKPFKSSPFISPIFGIEKTVATSNDMALENTANYEKLDAEIRKSNEFVMSLKELKENLD